MERGGILASENSLLGPQGPWRQGGAGLGGFFRLLMTWNWREQQGPEARSYVGVGKGVPLHLLRCRLSCFAGCVHSIVHVILALSGLDDG